jgi:hypothetical protein
MCSEVCAEFFSHAITIQDEQGISTFTQQLFLVSKGGDNNAAGWCVWGIWTEAGAAER